jgi:hypothetical protein
MNDIPRAATMTVPVTMKIGPVPDDVASHAQIFTFALANIKKILADKGISAVVSGEHALVTYAEADGAATTYTMNGQNVDDRHFRVQPDEINGHSLEISTDGGLTFAAAASFDDYDLANGIGRAWAEGRTEKAR